MNEAGITTIEDIPVSINPKSVTSRTTGQPMTIYEVETYKGLVVSTTVRDIAEQAHGLLNQPSILTVKMQQNGKYTNRYLQSITANSPTMVGAAMAKAQSAHAQAMPPTAATFSTYTPGGRTEPPQQPSPHQTPSLPTPEQAREEQYAREAKRNTSIYRQTATKVAAELSKTPDEFWANVAQLLHFYETGLAPEHRDTQAASPAPAQTEQFFPTDDPGSPLPPPTDDDIPF